MILITDIEGLGETDISELEMLQHKSNFVLFVVQDPLEANLSLAHGLSISEGKEQINIQVNNDNQQKYDALYQDKLQQLTLAMSGSSLPLGLLNTHDPVVNQLMMLLQGHE